MSGLPTVASTMSTPEKAQEAAMLLNAASRLGEDGAY